MPGNEKKIERPDEPLDLIDDDEMSADAKDEEDDKDISQYHQRQVAGIAITSVTSTSASHTITAKMNKRRLIDDSLLWLAWTGQIPRHVRQYT